MTALQLTVMLAALAFASCGRPSTQAAAPDQSVTTGRETTPLQLSTPRAAHSAVALANGDVLFFGGCVEDGCERGPASSTVDRFDYRSGSIARVGRLTGERVSMAAAALPSGKVLLAGGWAGSDETDAVELYDPNTGRARRVAALAIPRADIAEATLADGRILLAGGFANSRTQTVIEIFDPSTNKVAIAGHLQVPRAGAVAAVLSDGRVLIVGGGENGATGLVPSASAEIFDPATGSVVPAGRLAVARYKHAAVRLGNGRVLVIGGSDSHDRDGKISALEEFDPVTARFQPAGETLDARYKIDAAVLLLPDSRVLIAGGAAQPEIYDPATRRSARTGPNIGETLNFSTATLLPDGAVILAGGYSERGIRVSDRVWRVDPAAAGPAPAAPPPRP